VGHANFQIQQISQFLQFFLEQIPIGAVAAAAIT